MELNYELSIALSMLLGSIAILILSYAVCLIMTHVHEKRTISRALYEINEDLWKVYNAVKSLREIAEKLGNKNYRKS